MGGVPRHCGISDSADGLTCDFAYGSRFFTPSKMKFLRSLLRYPFFLGFVLFERPYIATSSNRYFASLLW